MVIAVAAFFTWNSVASASEPVRVHVMQNVTMDEQQEINKSLITLGYKPSDKALFSESPNAIIITKVLADDTQDASLNFELVHLDNEKDLPRTVFQYRMDGNDVHAMVKAFPKPEAFTEPAKIPVASAANLQPAR
jgi:hypothetical protein